MAEMNGEAYPNCRFYVEISGIAQAIFTEVSGLQMETVVTEYEEGGNNGFVFRLPGRTKIGNITLKRGLTASNELYKWFLDIARGKITRVNVSVVMYAKTGERLMSWEFKNAYPIKWTGPQFVSDGRVAAIETLELAHDGFKDS